MPLRKSSRCTMRLAWPSHRQVTADFFTTLFTYNFCRPVTSLHVTTEICSCDSLVNGHCSQQVSWNQPLKRKIKLADHVPADGVKVGITCILPVRCFALSKVSAPGHAALLWTLPNRVSAVAREGSQESATSRQAWELEHIRTRHVAFAKVAWSSGELLLLYISKITQPLSRKQIKAISHVFYSLRINQYMLL